jgi:hypothetical protein
MSKETFTHAKCTVSVEVKRSEYGVGYPNIAPVKDGVIVLAPQSETAHPEWAT